MKAEIKKFFMKIGSGYFRFFKWIIVMLIFLGLLVLFNYLTILPLRTLAVNYRIVYNSITIALISALLLAGVIKWIIRTGWLPCLVFLLLLCFVFVLFILPEKLPLFSALLTIPVFLLLYFIKVRKVIKPGMVTLLILLCYIIGFYRVMILFFSGWLFLAIPITVFYLLFLGFIMYEKRIHTNRKIFM